MPEIARKLADTWLTENPNLILGEKPRSHRGTAFRASENQASAIRASDSRASSTYKTDYKTEEKTVEQDPDAAIASSRVDASASTDCGANAPRDEDDRPPTDRRSKRRQTLGAYLKTLGTDAVDEIYWDLDATSKGGILSWAEPRARKELGLPVKGDWPEGEPDAALTLKVVEIALNTLRKRSYAEFGDVAEGYLDGFQWPPEKNMPQGAGGTPEAPLRYRHSPGFLVAQKGHEDAALANIHGAIDRMTTTEVADALELFERHRPDILRCCRRAAAKTAALRGDDGHGRQVLHAGAEHWRAKENVKWPKFVVPRELHPEEAATSAA